MVPSRGWVDDNGYIMSGSLSFNISFPCMQCMEMVHVPTLFPWREAIHSCSGYIDTPNLIAGFDKSGVTYISLRHRNDMSQFHTSSMARRMTNIHLFLQTKSKRMIRSLNPCLSTPSSQSGPVSFRERDPNILWTIVHWDPFSRIDRPY